jgi:hypothetical protein
VKEPALELVNEPMTNRLTCVWVGGAATRPSAMASGATSNRLFLANECPPGDFSAECFLLTLQAGGKKIANVR